MVKPCLSAALLGVLIWACAPAGAQTQDPPADSATGVQAPQDEGQLSPSQRHALAVKQLRETERELKKLRATYFRNRRNTELRQLGIIKLREYTDPALFPSMLEIFRRDGDDVRGALLDHLADQESIEGDVTLAWVAVREKDPAFREAAGDRLVRRAEETGGVPYDVQCVIADGLRSSNDRVLGAAANAADLLNLYEAIPMLITAQIGGGGERDQPKGDLGYILIGKQTAYVSDLQPVVAENAVGFDPQISVLTEGTLLRISDAVVTTYRYEVHDALNRLGSRGWGGRSLGYLGWDQEAWRRWYAEEFVPHRKSLGEGGGKNPEGAPEPGDPALAPGSGGGG